MIYRSIRIILSRLEQSFACLHKIWLDVPKKVSRGANYKIIPLSQVESELIRSTQGNIESQFFPKIVNHTNGGQIYVNVPPIELRLFHNVSFVFGSNFIRFCDNTVFHQKILRNESTFSSPGDQDLLFIRNEKCRLKK
jgi:hypothetical protein